MSRFLLASDDARTRIGIAGALERAGHGVDRVTHLRLAALHADLRPIDAVVVGLQQPLRRQHFIETVRARNERVPVIALLDSNAYWHRARLETLGVTTILTRPLAVAELVARLEGLARLRSTSRPNTPAGPAASGVAPRRPRREAPTVA